MIDHCINKSLDEGVWITIIYEKKNEITSRDVKVHKIENNIITCYCKKSKGIRSFKRERILAAELKAE